MTKSLRTRQCRRPHDQRDRTRPRQLPEINISWMARLTSNVAHARMRSRERMIMWDPGSLVGAINSYNANFAWKNSCCQDHHHCRGYLCAHDDELISLVLFKLHSVMSTYWSIFLTVFLLPTEDFKRLLPCNCLKSDRSFVFLGPKSSSVLYG